MMRRLAFPLLLLAVAPAQAEMYALTDAQGVVNCVKWDGVTPYVAPAGSTITPKPDCAPTPAAKSTTISTLAFWDRFTDGEKAALVSNPNLQVWIVTATAAQSVDLAGARTKQGMDAAVALGILTADRAAAVVVP